MYDNNIISYIIVNSEIMPFNNGCTIACRKLTTNVCTNYGKINRCTYTALAFIGIRIICGTVQNYMAQISIVTVK